MSFGPDSWVISSIGYSMAGWLAMLAACSLTAASSLTVHRVFGSRVLDLLAFTGFCLGGPFLAFFILNLLHPSDRTVTAAPLLLLASSVLSVLIFLTVRKTGTPTPRQPLFQCIAVALVVLLGSSLALLGLLVDWTAAGVGILVWPGVLVFGPVWPNGYHHYDCWSGRVGWYCIALASLAGWTLFVSSLRALWRAA